MLWTCPQLTTPALQSIAMDTDFQTKQARRVHAAVDDITKLQCTDGHGAKVRMRQSQVRGACN